MDPTQTMIDLQSAVDTGDMETAKELAEALRDWIDKGGFLPTGQEANRRLIRGYCVQILRS